MSYIPIPGTYVEVFISLTPSFNPTGWDGSVWTALPNKPSEWNGTDKNLYTMSAANPIECLGLTPGVTYYIRCARVDEYGNRSDPNTEVSCVPLDSQRASTLVLAAYNASESTKAGADFVCDGIDDQETEQAAIDALPIVIIETGTAQAGAATTITLRSTAGDIDDMYNGLNIYITGGQGVGQSKTISDYVGSTKIATVSSAWSTNPNNTSVYEIRSRVGKVIKTEGTFIKSGAVKIYSNVSIAGMGSGTIDKVKDGLNLNINLYENDDTTNGNFNINIENITLDGNRPNNTNSQIAVNFAKVRKSSMKELNVKAFRGAGIYLTSCESNVIQGNHIEQVSGVGVYLGSGSKNQVINNICEKNLTQSIFLDNSTDNKIDGNTCNNNYDGIFLSTSGNNTVNNNICSSNTHEGMVIYGDNNTINANECNLNNRNGIRLVSANHNTVSNNNLSSNGQLTNNTYSNILLEASSKNDITGNKCQKGDLTNKSKYGIRIDDPVCDSNLITNNFCQDSGQTAGISNAGTNTDPGAGNKVNSGLWSTSFS